MKKTDSARDSLCLYQIDASDRIVEVDESWDRFALANQGTAMASKQVLGRELWQFITGEESLQIYRSLVDRVRGQKVAARFYFRCDAPECRRFMSMRIGLGADRSVYFASRIERIEPRSAVSLLDSAIVRDRRMVTVCSWCKAVKCESRWLPVEEAVERLGLFAQPSMPALSHGICESCHTTMENQLHW